MPYFIKKENEFRQTDFNGSIRDLVQHLGYHHTQIHTSYGFKNDPVINIAGFELFTKNIVLMHSLLDIECIEEHQIEHYLLDFDPKFEYGSYNAKDFLEDGIKNQSLKIDFLARVLDIKEPNDNGIIYVENLGLNLLFIDGQLTYIQTADGLNEWARMWKENNPAWLKLYEEVAKVYWRDNLSMVIKEINKQAAACYWIPDCLRNEFIPIHKSELGTINFYMLKVCHYVKSITLLDFLEINHGRYKEIKPAFNYSLINTKKYSVDRFMYEFSEDGVLLQFYQL